ncbi:hypothetical protein TKK_0009663 [Trichogramma kaykai]|uniref:RING-type domain-containing protein n=1 Tax=Trichogramma kaykai TaxID=54128 RepID=A0ABD2X0D6_9HYME
MADNTTLWVKTHKVINRFYKDLTCGECNQRLLNPQQFLNCGHFVCSKCRKCKTDCPECGIPGKLADVHSDSVVNDVIINLEKIAQAVGLVSLKTIPTSKASTSLSRQKSSSSINEVMKKPTIAPPVRSSRSKITIDDPNNTTYCESIASTSTRRGKANDVIPKNIDKKNKKGETQLHIACRSDNVDRVRLLLDAGANPNTKDNAGWTPLQEAASYGYYEVCELLITKGTNLDMHGFESRTALHDAILNKEADVAALLVQAGANKDVFDNVGKKPIDYCSSPEILKIFDVPQDTSDDKSEIVSDLKTIDLNRTTNISSEPKIVLFGSNLKPKNKKLLMKLGTEKKIRVVNSLSPIVSHVIVDTDSTLQLQLTFDILMTILYGKWILTSDILSILMENENITANALSLFEVNPPQLDNGPSCARENNEKQNPKLFNNCSFYFAIKSHDWIHYEGMKISKDQLMKLIAAGDGVTLTREPKPEDIQGSLSPFHVAHDTNHSLHKCTHYIIYDYAEGQPSRIMYNLPFLKTLPLMWLIESILRFKLLDPIDMGLLIEDTP